LQYSHRLSSRPRYRVVSLVTHADIPDIIWADEETGCATGCGAEMLEAKKSSWSSLG